MISFMSQRNRTGLYFILNLLVFTMIYSIASQNKYVLFFIINTCYIQYLNDHISFFTSKKFKNFRRLPTQKKIIELYQRTTHDLNRQVYRQVVTGGEAGVDLQGVQLHICVYNMWIYALPFYPIFLIIVLNLTRHILFVNY